MARKPASAASPPPAPAAGPVRDRLIDALMSLAAERDWDEIGIADIAARAGVSLADMRDAFPSKGSMLAGFNRRIDRVVLDGASDDLDEEPPRDRVFDVMMRRFDALTPYKDALRRMAPSLRRDPLTLAALNQLALNSQRFMLASAGVDVDDRLAAVKIQGAVLVFARVLDTWLDDDEPGLAKTMAKLDTELGNGERVLGVARDMQRLTAPLCDMMSAMSGRRGGLRDRLRQRFRERADDRRNTRDDRDTLDDTVTA